MYKVHSHALSTLCLIVSKQANKTKENWQRKTFIFTRIRTKNIHSLFSQLSENNRK